jgi:DNA adenine methylase
MKYLGGKFHCRKRIAPFIRRFHNKGQTYIEPFLGAAWIMGELADLEGPRIGSDLHEHLIAMWQALQAGWIPPENCSEKEYCLLKAQMKAGKGSKALQGFIGFNCAFGGKWFSTYARDKRSIRQYCAASKISVLKQIQNLKNVQFIHRDYREIKPLNSLVYCDPPYAGVAGYSVGKFDSVEFWETMEKWAKNNTIIVSEYKAPENWRCVLEMPTNLFLRSSEGCAPRLEKLFMLK